MVHQQLPRQARPRRQMQVHTRFEPSHVAQQCLVEAYVRLVPLWRRSVRSAAPPASPATGPIQERQARREGQRGSSARRCL
jgi:hypothetical protein